MSASPVRLLLPLVAAFTLALALAPQPARAAHAVAQFGEPKYRADFTHFDYVNPDAPKGGTLNLSNTGTSSSFDKLNPFSLKGRQAPGLLELTFETLTIYSLDERNTQYGLLAQEIFVEKDFSAVTFVLHPDAHFSNGDPVTAQDVKYSFDTLSSPQASPAFVAYFSEIMAVTVLDAKTVRFDFKRPGRDLSFVAGSLPVFSPKWARRADGSTIPFNELRMEAPIASGPYVIEKAVENRGLTYRRNPNYWGDHIPARRGTLNFDKVEYKLYKDIDTQVSALRAGQYDFFNEIKMRYWCCQYIGKRFDSGELIKERVPHSNPPGMTGYAFNIRRDRFKDPRVREALNYAFDFEWVNQKIFDNGFGRVASYFIGTPLEARGLPDEAELKVLEPYRDQLDPKVFGPIVELPVNPTPASIRQNLVKALDLFAQAGWHVKDGVLQNARGEPFVIEVSGTRGSNMLMDPYYFNLKKIGIEVRERLADSATSRARMNAFNYDFIPFSLRESRMPGGELLRAFNSRDADRPGSENTIGVKSPVIDALIEKLLDASSQEEMETTGRALDRVLRHGHYVQPWRYMTHHHLIYNKRLRRPDTLPLYYGANEWVISTWWDGNVETVARAKADARVTASGH